MTINEARALGYIVARGEYQGTTDNRLDRWYTGRVGEDWRPIGAGHRTRAAALEAVKELVAYDRIGA